ncbi:hypothetical protein D9619_011192 [Psilocybe cf. subviscida]|uniref:Uncharacterized protein n=1 Tax=Psilocybe cf. subviscida TaxID=2480587 RepID=A0A8H5F5D2_9AGAR|nr:hypothetical protein D9619_011192 [Psilocybe cf. subviscida]
MTSASPTRPAIHARTLYEHIYRPYSPPRSSRTAPSSMMLPPPTVSAPTASSTGSPPPSRKHTSSSATRAIHAGSGPTAESGAVIPPILLRTAYQQEAIGVYKPRGDGERAK